MPAAFGRFEREFIFRRICPPCNSRIGRCEEQLLRCSPEAFVRRVVNPPVKRENRGMSWVGAHGVPPPKFTVDHGDHLELVEGSPTNPRDVLPVDQLVIVDDHKGMHHIRLHPQMTVGQLRAKIAAAGLLKPSGKSFLHADDAAWPKYVVLLGEIWPDSPVIQTEGRDRGVHRVQGRTIFSVHADYWRAIAKIGFHYYLLNTRRGYRGQEPAFAPLREYIMMGGDRSPFFTLPATKFVLPFCELPGNRAVVSPQWAHYLAADETLGAATAMVSLFTGPDRVAPVYHLNIAALKSSLAIPRARWGHSYQYSTAADGVLAGRVIEEELVRLS